MASGESERVGSNGLRPPHGALNPVVVWDGWDVVVTGGSSWLTFASADGTRVLVLRRAAALAEFHALIGRIALRPPSIAGVSESIAGCDGRPVPVGLSPTGVVTVGGCRIPRELLAELDEWLGGLATPTPLRRLQGAGEGTIFWSPGKGLCVNASFRRYWHRFGRFEAGELASRLAVALQSRASGDPEGRLELSGLDGAAEPCGLTVSADLLGRIELAAEAGRFRLAMSLPRARAGLFLLALGRHWQQLGVQH